MSPIDGLHPVTTEGQILLHISGQLDELLDAVRPDPAPVAPAEPEADAPADEKPVPKPPAKKAAARRKVTGQ